MRELNCNRTITNCSKFFRSQCFSTQYFMGCVDVLLLTDECTTIIKMIEFLRGSPLNINSSCTIKKPTKEDIRRNPFQSSPY